MNTIGKCPLCGEDVIEYDKNFSCSGYKKTGCRFTIWKNPYGHIVTEDEAVRLINGEEIGPFDLKTKDGRDFKAKLVYSTDEKRVKPSWDGLNKEEKAED